MPKNRRQYTSRFSLIVEQVLAFTWSTILVKKVKNVPTDFKRIAWLHFSLEIILIRIGSWVLSNIMLK